MAAFTEHGGQEGGFVGGEAKERWGQARHKIINNKNDNNIFFKGVVDSPFDVRRNFSILKSSGLNHVRPRYGKFAPNSTPAGAYVVKAGRSNAVETGWVSQFWTPDSRG
jgi:hypothetical protein